MKRKLPTYRSKIRLALGVFLCCLIAATYVFVDVLAGSLMREGRERALAQAAQNLVQHLEEDIDDVFRDLALASSPIGPATISPENARIEQTRLNASRALMPSYAWIATANLDGIIVSATDNTLLGLDVNNQAWFFQGRSANTMIDAPAEHFESETPAPITELSRFLEISMPIHGRDGQSVGVIAVGIKSEWVQDTQKLGLRPIAHLPGVEVLIASRDGRILAGGARPGGTKKGELGDPAAFIAQSAKAGTLGYLPRLGWQVIARQPRAEALGAIHRFRLMAMAGIAAIGFIAFLLAEGIARSFAAPFERLTVAAAAFKDDPTRPVAMPEATTREVEKLTNSLSDAFESVGRTKTQLRRLNNELERQVAERTKELLVAKDKAEAATLAKGEFLATMSHEIRSPLGSIVGLTDLLLEDHGIVGRQRGRLELIQSASSGLTALINDVLDFSKIESDAIELSKEAFDLAAVLETCCGLIQVQSDRKGVMLVRDWPTALPIFIGDQLRLRQVITNLLSNAVKFTSKGSVTLRLRYDPEPETRVGIEVIDTGVGIPPATVGKLFARYAQADVSIQSEFGGTGLGLAISQRLVGLMGGTIEIASVVGRGSTFGFSIALQKADCKAESTQLQPVRRLKALNILLADDLVANQDFIGALLRSQEHHVEIVSDGLEAVESAGRTPFDVILLDIQMPGLDGVSAARAIRQGGGLNAESPIVALTANTSSDHCRRFQDAGMNAYVAKPVVRRDLFTTIAELAARKNYRPSADLSASVRGNRVA